MSGQHERVDVAVIGSGPAGQKAAIQAAKVGKRTVVIEREAVVGGACVHLGTIPSKTLRETAQVMTSFRKRLGGSFNVEAREEIKIQSLMKRLEQVVAAHQSYIGAQLARNGIETVHGRARFVDPHTLEVQRVDGSRRRIEAALIVIATGSRPRAPEGIPIDHQQVFDSDSILSINYLPATLTVLGAGVIASEYASIFAALGVEVTLADAAPRPVSFMDSELTDRFLAAFQRAGGKFLPGHRVKTVESDGFAGATVTFENGVAIGSEKVLVALGRVANVQGLEIQNAGLETTSRGHLAVDQDLRTAQPHIYGAGDVVGPPSLAASSMEQGRRVVLHALGLPAGAAPETIPTGIYTIPEISSVGLTEQQACEKYGSALIGRARFEEIARGQINANEDGFMKLVADPSGTELLGVHVVSEGACDLVHIGQMAIAARLPIDSFIDNIFNFPTLAEGYRVAALEIVKQRVRVTV